MDYLINFMFPIIFNFMFMFIFIVIVSFVVAYILKEYFGFNIHDKIEKLDRRLGMAEGNINYISATLKVEISDNDEKDAKILRMGHDIEKLQKAMCVCEKDKTKVSNKVNKS